MNVTTFATGVTMQPHGALDQDGCLALRKTISTALSSGLHQIVLDLAEVTLLEDEAVQLLRGVDNYLNRMGGGLVLINPPAAAQQGPYAAHLADLLLVDDVPFPADRRQRAC